MKKPRRKADYKVTRYYYNQRSIAEALGIHVGDRILRIYADGENLVNVELWETDEGGEEKHHAICTT